MDLSPKDAELVIGLVARIGVDTREVVGSIKHELSKYHYSVEEIHVTDQLKAFSPPLSLVQSPAESRYSSYINACNALRRVSRNDVMAMLAMTEIVGSRDQPGRDADIIRRQAYVINQIKRPEEFELLRQVYGEHYVQISCHAHESTRIEKLTKRIVQDHPEDPKSPTWDLKARELVHKDESEENELCGQRVRQVFPLSDIILDATTSSTINVGIERFFRALFGDKSVTPTREEYGMELANTVAQRSSDLSRQVGAAIVTPRMEVQALGCNEVAKARGGTYWEGDSPDGRDFALGRDSNADRRQAVIIDLMLRLKDAKALRSDLQSAEAIKGLCRDNAAIADAQIMDSLEYGRSVHAEMNAIADAVRVGHRLDGCKLFSNTFPCHNCAKHIVAAGITEVIYIHPYPKSYARELFDDSIEVDPAAPDQRRVTFRQFIGILGPMYSRVFTKARWKKEDGTVATFVKSQASYIRRTPLPAYSAIEPFILDQLRRMLHAAGYISDPE